MILTYYLGRINYNITTVKNMSKEHDDEIFKLIKQSLESDFGTIPDSFVAELLSICKAFPDFIAFYKASKCGSIIAALELYLNQFERKDKYEYIKLTFNHAPNKSVIYFLLLGYTFFKALEYAKKKCKNNLNNDLNL